MKRHDPPSFSDAPTLDRGPAISDEATTADDAGWPRSDEPVRHSLLDEATGQSSLDLPVPQFDDPRKRYAELERLGVGGMGEVHCAFDAKVGREVALKRMLPGRSNVEQEYLLGRFLREARIQALLEHPSIVPVYDLDIAQNGLPFFSMKRVQGETFESIIRGLLDNDASTRERYTRHKLLSAFVTVCLAVAFAHERGVVHRDLKPANIMLGDHGEVYVLDWGLAKVLAETKSPARSQDPKQTARGSILGTPGYMSPEQAEGNADAVDGRTDVYALGSILFELLTLMPVHGDHSHVAVLASTLDPAFKPPKVSSDVAPELLDLATRALAYRRDDRPASARVLADAVDAFLAGDRDVALRQSLAEARAAAAKRMADDAVRADDEGLRAGALREAGRALALDPGHAGALSVVVELLAAPTKRVPAEVAREVAERDTQRKSYLMRTLAMRMTTWLVLAPLPFFMGVHYPVFGAVAVSLIVIAVAYGLLAGHLRATGRAARFGMCAVSSLAAGALSAVFGPFIVVPISAATNTMFFATASEPEERPLLAVVALSAVLVPLALEWTGVLPPSMTVTANAITLHARVTDFPEIMTWAFLIASSTLGIVTPLFFAGRLGDAIRKAEERLVLQSWNLRQLAHVDAKR